MSTTIDERVLEMRFDNRQFESNVSSTMSTLDKLKQKLNFTGASKGLEDINTATKNVNMTGLGSAVETVTAKFSALQVMGVTALANITNSAVNAGKNIIKSLTIDPIMSGFSEYETKMGSIQTILANTEHQGTTMDDVTAALEELNLYADKTIYNFQEMTRNIGTFTAAGVDLDTSVRSIQGIANLAAVSGSTSQQASTAMYQLSQALASGTVKLTDWNSVVNAGMGGKVFQNALIRTAAAMDGASENVEAWQKKNIDAYGSFRDSLTSSGWLTTDVLTETLKQFTMAAEEGSEEWETFKKSLMADGYTEKQAKEILKMANTATDAATKVKTFTQLMDTLKESAQSGWAQTWELIIGDFEEAKEFFTGLSDIFGGIIGESANRRNSLLENALGSNWDKLVGTLGDAGIEASKFEEAIRKVYDSDDELDELITKHGSLSNAVRDGAIGSDVLRGALDAIVGTGANETIADFVEGLKEIGTTLKRGDTGEEVKKLQTALKELGYDLGAPGIDGIIGPITEKAIKAFQEANNIKADGIVGPDTLDALEKAGIKVEELNGDAKELRETCDGLVDAITEKSGRELLLDSLMNVIKAIQRPLSAVGEALRDVFSVSPDQLYNALEAINKFTKKLVPKGLLDVKTWKGIISGVTKLGIKYVDFMDALEGTLEEHGVDVEKLKEQYDNLGNAFDDGAISIDIIKEALLGFDGITESLLVGGETAEKVRRTFEGLFAIFEIIATLAAGPIKIAFKLVTKTLEKLGLGLLDITANVGDSIVTLRDNITSVVEAVTEFISGGIAKWISDFKETEFFKTVAGWFEDASKTISDAIDNITEKIRNFDESSFMTVIGAVGGFLYDIGSSVAKSDTFIFIVDSVCSAFERVKNFFTGFKLPEFSLDNLRIFTGLGSALEGAGGLGGSLLAMGTWLKDRTITKAKGAINNLFSFANWDEFKAAAVEKFTSFWTSTGDKIKAAFKKIGEIFQSVGEFLFGTEKISLPVILDVAQKFLGLLVLIKTLKLLNTLASPFDNVTSALDNLSKKMKWDAIGNAFKAMALALGTLTVCILVLANMPDMNRAAAAAGMLAGLLVVMGLLIGGLMLVANKLKTKDAFDVTSVALSLVLLIGAVYLMTHTLEKIDGMTLRDPAGTFGALTLMLLGLAAGIKIVAAAGSSSFNSVAAILTLVASLKLMLDVITQYDEYNWAGKSDAIWRVAEMLVILSAAINIASRGIKSGAGATGLATLLLAMVFSLKILLGVMSDFAAMPTDDLIKGGLAIAVLMGLMAWMMVEVGAANSNDKVLGKGEKVANNFTGLATALLAVVASIWILGKLATKDPKTFYSGIATVAGILTAFTVMIAVIGKSCSGLKMGVVITALIGMGVLIAEVAVLLKWLEDVPWQQSLGTAGALAAVLIAMAAALKIMSKNQIDGGNIAKWEFALLAMVGIAFVLSLVLSSMDDVGGLNAIGNATALAGLLLAMSGCLKILSGVKFEKGDLGKVAGGVIVLSVVVGVLGHVLKQMNDVVSGNAIGNATALAGLLLAMSGCLKILSGVKFEKGDLGKVAGGVIVLSVVVGVLGHVLKQMNDVVSGNAIGNATALSVLLGVISVCLLGLSKLKIEKLGDIGKMAIGLLALGVVVGLLGHILKRIDGIDANGALANAKALSNLVLALSIAMIPISLLGKYAGWDIIPGVAMLAVILTELYIAADVLANMDGLQNATTNTKALSNLVLALSIAMVPIALIGQFAAGGVVVGVIAMAALMAELHIVVKVLSNMEGLKNAEANANVLTSLVGALTLCLLAISLVSILVYPALVAVVALGIMIESVSDVVAALIAMDKLQNAQTSADAIGSLLNVLADIIERVAEHGVNAPIAAAAISTLATVVTKLGVLAGAVGGLSSLMDGKLEAFVGSGIELFKKLARGLGEIISEFGVGLTSGMPDIATNLSQFAFNLLPFVATMTMIDDDIIDKAKNLALAIGALVGSDVLNTLSEKMNGDLAALGTELTGFAWNMSGFSSAMADFKPETVAAVESLGSALNALTSANLKDAIVNILPGDNSLSTFGGQLAGFAEGMKSASAALKDITDEDVEAIKRSAVAGQALADLNAAIPSSGGKWQEWVGEKNFSEWGKTLVDFGDSIVAYSEKVSGQNFDTAAIEASASAAKALADTNAAIPSSGGKWQEWAGDKNMADWGKTLVDFGDCLVQYSAKVSGQDFDAEAITASAGAAQALADLNGKLPSQNGLWEAVVGEKDMGEFGTQLISFADGILAYANTAVQLDQTKIDAITNSGEAIDELVAVVEKVPETGGWADKIVGASDGQGFGAALSSMASGILSYCNIAATVVASIETIKSSKEAITELGSILESAPEATEQQKAYNLAIIASDMQSFASTLHAITTAEYDYTGLGRIKTQITRIKAITEDTDFAVVSEGIDDLKNVAKKIVDTAKKIADLNDYTYAGVSRFKAAVNSLKDVSFDGIKEAFANSDGAVSAMTSVVDGMARAVSNNIGKVTSAMENLASAAMNIISQKEDGFKSMGKTLGEKFAKGLSNTQRDTKTATTSCVSAAVNVLSYYYTNFYNMGKYLVEGFAAGIEDKTWLGENAARDLAKAAIMAAKKQLLINSPSKVFRDIGMGVPEGFALGVEKYSGLVDDSIVDMTDSAVNSVGNTISRLADVINSDIDAQPTIRPILDLSDVEAGASTIGNLFDTNSRVGVLANLGTVGAMMGRYGQNGGNSDIVSAIDKLRKDLGNISGDSYSVGNITYDDGSNIADAVKTIARAAKMERRI